MFIGVQTKVSKMNYHEITYSFKFISWGFLPRYQDSIVRNDECKVTNLRRADYLFETHGGHFLVVECDEHEHSSYTVCHEISRINDLVTQVYSNFGNLNYVPFLVIIRFNPYGNLTTQEENDLKSTIDYYIKSTDLKCSDDRGFILHDKLFGYSERRTRIYNRDEMTKQWTFDNLNETKNKNTKRKLVYDISRSKKVK